MKQEQNPPSHHVLGSGGSDDHDGIGELERVAWSHRKLATAARASLRVLCLV